MINKLLKAPYLTSPLVLPAAPAAAQAGWCRDKVAGADRQPLRRAMVTIDWQSQGGAYRSNRGKTDGAVASVANSTDTNPSFANIYFRLATALVGSVSFAPGGSMVSAEARRKDRDLKPTGPSAETETVMLASLAATVSTTLER